MDYMAKHGMKRARPAQTVAGPLRVITARMAYLPADLPTSIDAGKGDESGGAGEVGRGTDDHGRVEQPGKAAGAKGGEQGGEQGRERSSEAAGTVHATLSGKQHAAV